MRRCWIMPSCILKITNASCLVGRNGAGKSTLMKILNREQGLDDGRIIYEQDLIVARPAAGSAAERCWYGTILSPKGSPSRRLI